MPEVDLANVVKISNGMVTFVKSLSVALEGEYLMFNINNVYVLIKITGMELSVLKNLNVVVVKNGMKRHLLVIALKGSTGMAETVFYVHLEKCGIKSVVHVFAHLELNGITNFVQLSKTVGVE